MAFKYFTFRRFCCFCTSFDCRSVSYWRLSIFLLVFSVFFHRKTLFNADLIQIPYLSIKILSQFSIIFPLKFGFSTKNSNFFTKILNSNSVTFETRIHRFYVLFSKIYFVLFTLKSFISFLLFNIQQFRWLCRKSFDYVAKTKTKWRKFDFVSPKFA